ncbi:MAG TPA: hypothetical protein VIK78_20390 [Ruminiclostridium sp.]
MLKNKKAIMVLSFCIGATMLVTTAFADISTKTGYDQAKDALKFTAESLIEKSQSYTLQTIVSVKDNGSLLTSNTSITKADSVNKKSESIITSEDKAGKKQESFNYTDKDTYISHNNDNDTYYVTEMTGDKGNTYDAINKNPFKEDTAKDAEKIVDAVIGSLKDYVIVNDNADGTKELSGSLSEAQIPALINAVASFGFKQTLSTSSMMAVKPGLVQDKSMVEENLPTSQITEDIFIKSVKASAKTDKNGLLESVLASATLSGKDKSGTIHEISLDLLVRVTDVNSTVITKPDLTGKKIEKNIQVAPDSKTVSKSFIGKYKNDIVILKDDKFIKIGERFVVIAGISDTNIEGRYYEEYKAQYASEYTKEDFTFDAEMKDGYFAEFNFKSSDGESQMGNISWNMQSGNINFYAGQQDAKNDGNFVRVFD